MNFTKTARSVLSLTIAFLTTTSLGDTIAVRLSKAGMKAEVKSADTVLITEGFPYWKDDVVSQPDKYRILIESVQSDHLFVTTKDSVQPFSAGIGGMFLVTRGSTMFLPRCTAKNEEEANNPSGCDSVGLKWTFANSDTSFTVKGLSFKTKRKGATIEFRKDGVLVAGFDFIARAGSTNAVKVKGP